MPIELGGAGDRLLGHVRVGLKERIGDGDDVLGDHPCAAHEQTVDVGELLAELHA